MIKDGLLLQQGRELILPPVVHSGHIVQGKGLAVHIQANEHVVTVVPVHAVGNDLRAVNAGNIRRGGEYLSRGLQRALKSPYSQQCLPLSALRSCVRVYKSFRDTSLGTREWALRYQPFFRRCACCLCFCIIIPQSSG